MASKMPKLPITNILFPWLNNFWVGYYVVDLNLLTLREPYPLFFRRNFKTDFSLSSPPLISLYHNTSFRLFPSLSPSLSSFFISTIPFCMWFGNNGRNILMNARVISKYVIVSFLFHNKPKNKFTFIKTNCKINSGCYLDSSSNNYFWEYLKNQILNSLGGYYLRQQSVLAVRDLE